MDLRETAIRRGLMAGAAIGVLVTAMPAAAQQGQVEEIVITGSRIASSNLNSPSPLQVVGGEDIDIAASATLQDVLLKNPTFGAPSISRTNSNFQTASAGAATIDLRNLGVDRTLVLVNGRRFVSGIPGSAAVDLNTIPTQFIDRVEVLTGGASAVYGSDAVAGVVNIIYKQDFEGIEADARYGISEEGDGIEKDVSLMMGGNFGDNRGNIVGFLGYSNQGAVFSRNRDFAAVDQSSLGALDGDPSHAFTPSRPYYSSFAPQGRFTAGGRSFTYDKNNNLISGFSTNGTATRAADGFNRSDYRTIAIPTERYLFATQGDYEVNDNLRFFMEGTYAGTQTKTEIEPFGLASDDIFPATVWNIQNPDGTRNPLVPTALYDAATDTNGDGLKDLVFTRRLREIGNRGNTADRDTYRFLVGADGDIPMVEGWRYETYLGYGKTSESQVSNGQVNVQSFRHALDAIVDVNDVNSNGNRTELICRDADARAQGCHPINLFGFGSISPEAAKYVAAPGMLSTFTQQTIAGLNVTGDVVDLPAGALGVALGTEYRAERSRSEFDALQQSGLNAGNAIPATRGDFDVFEGYAETNVPILADMPFAKQLNLRGAVRFSDYSTVGTTTSWNVGGEWQPIDDIRFRVIRAQSVRAPNISELYSPPSQNYPTGLIDPCEGIGATGGGVIGENCRRDPGVLSNIATNGKVTFTQSDVQGISGFDLGNPDLSEEKGKSWTIGAVITPTIEALSAFSMTVDYFNVKIEDAITAIPRQFILDQCYRTNDQEYCKLIRRYQAFGVNSAGAIDEVDQPIANAGSLATSGLDITLNHRLDLEDIGLAGQLNSRLAYTHVFKGYVIPLEGAEKDSFNGEIGTPRDKAALNLIYGLDNLSVAWTTTWIGNSYLDNQFLASMEWPGNVGVGNWFYHDVQIRYAATENFELYAGADNVFDKKPAPILSNLPGNETGTETASGTYDAIGRFFYAGVKVTF